MSDESEDMLGELTADIVRIDVVSVGYGKSMKGAEKPVPTTGAVLRDSESGRFFFMVIGHAEAQSIALCLNKDVHLPRPLTHDLMTNILHSYGLNLRFAVIDRMQKGVFCAKLVFASSSAGELQEEAQKNVQTFDARPSDAIALALRLGVNVYMKREILDFACAKFRVSTLEDEVIHSKRIEDLPLDYFTDDELQKMMLRASEREHYERAAQLKQELERRKGSAPSVPINNRND